MAIKKQATAGVTPKKVRTKKGLAAAGAWPAPNQKNPPCSAPADLPGFKPAKPAFDPTKPVETRDGRKARIICTDANQPLGPIVALVTMYDGTEEPLVYHADGTYIKLVGKDDLVNAPSRAEVPGDIRFVGADGNARKFYVSVALVEEVPVAVKILREVRA